METSKLNLGKPEDKVINKEVSKEKEIKFPFYEHKEVYIKRVLDNNAFMERNSDSYSDVNKKIGASFKNQDTLRGLNLLEEKRFLPDIIGVSPTEQGWTKAAGDYWKNISKKVPLEGLKLEVGVIYETKEQYDADRQAKTDHNNTRLNIQAVPINLNDYILWRYCLVYSKVANDETLIKKSPNIEFFLYSKEKEISTKKAIVNLTKEARMLLYKNLGDREWVDWVLRVLISRDNDPMKKVSIVTLDSLDQDEKDILLSEYVDKTPSEFKAIAEDKQLQIKSFIETCVAAGKLERIANTQSITFEGSTIGNTLEQTAAFLTDPKNNNILSTLKAQLNHTK